MKGAMAEPWVAKSSAPNNAIVIIIGASQNFLRTRKKAQNSPIKLRITFLSELPLHIRCPGFRRLALDPIAGRRPISCDTPSSFAPHPRDKPPPRHPKKEQQR